MWLIWAGTQQNLQNIFFFFGFYGPSRLFHSFWAESVVRWGENVRSPRKTTWPPASRTLLVSHVTRARLEPTAMRWSKDLVQNDRHAVKTWTNLLTHAVWSDRSMSALRSIGSLAAHRTPSKDWYCWWHKQITEVFRNLARLQPWRCLPSCFRQCSNVRSSCALGLCSLIKGKLIAYATF